MFFDASRLVADYLEFATKEDYKVVLGEEMVESLMMFCGFTRKQAEKTAQLAMSYFE